METEKKHVISVVLLLVVIFITAYKAETFDVN